jgi:hypothetical protein
MSKCNKQVWIRVKNQVFNQVCHKIGDQVRYQVANRGVNRGVNEIRYQTWMEFQGLMENCDEKVQKS